MVRVTFVILFIYVVALMGCADSGAGMEGQYEGKTGHRYHERGHSEKLQLSGSLENDVRIIKVKAFRYGFEPDPIVVKFGEKVKLEVISTDLTHGMAIKDFGVNLVIPPGKTESVEFTADKRGTFHIYCSVYCGPGHGNMHGSLIVIE